MIIENVRNIIGPLYLADVNGVQMVLFIRDGQDPIEAARFALNINVS